MIYTSCLVLMLIAAVGVFIHLLFFTAPYGRYYQKHSEMSVPNRLGWVIMESPAVICFFGFYLKGLHATQIVPLTLFALWQFHYVYRSFVFPFRIHSNHKRMPLVVMISAFLFNCFNAYLNAYWITNIGFYSLRWMMTPQFILGCLLFFIGFFIHYRADSILIHLRAPGETQYKIPKGFLFRWVVSPNYLGEIMSWIGFAMASWSLAAALFALFTVANLLPRAVAHRRWYCEQFKDFPKARRALIPYVL